MKIASMFFDTTVGQSVEWERKESGSEKGLTAERKVGVSTWMGKVYCKVKLSWGPAPAPTTAGDIFLAASENNLPVSRAQGAFVEIESDTAALNPSSITSESLHPQFPCLQNGKGKDS